MRRATELSAAGGLRTEYSGGTPVLPLVANLEPRPYNMITHCDFPNMQQFQQSPYQLAESWHFFNQDFFVLVEEE